MRAHKLRIAEVARPFDPDTVTAMGDAFESAWAEVAHEFSACDIRVGQRARLVLAEAIMDHATKSRDVDHLRHVGLRALVLLYPWLFEGHRKHA